MGGLGWIEWEMEGWGSGKGVSLLTFYEESENTHVTVIPRAPSLDLKVKVSALLHSLHPSCSKYVVLLPQSTT